MLDALQHHISTGEGHTGDLFDMVQNMGQLFRGADAHPGHIVKIAGDVKALRNAFMGPYLSHKKYYGSHIMPERPTAKFLLWVIPMPLSVESLPSFKINVCFKM